jgi:hypothetical protein
MMPRAFIIPECRGGQQLELVKSGQESKWRERVQRLQKVISFSGRFQDFDVSKPDFISMVLESNVSSGN